MAYHVPTATREQANPTPTSANDIGPTWVLLEALPDDVPASVRFRRLLKVALRSFRLRCRKVQAAEPDSAKDERMGK